MLFDDLFRYSLFFRRTFIQIGTRISRWTIGIHKTCEKIHSSRHIVIAIRPLFSFNDQRSCAVKTTLLLLLDFFLYSAMLIGSSRPHYDVMSAQFEVISTVIRLFFFFFVSLIALNIIRYIVNSFPQLTRYARSFSLIFITAAHNSNVIITRWISLE